MIDTKGAWFVSSTYSIPSPQCPPQDMLDIVPRMEWRTLIWTMCHCHRSPTNIHTHTSCTPHPSFPHATTPTSATHRPAHPTLPPACVGISPPPPLPPPPPRGRFLPLPLPPSPSLLSESLLHFLSIAVLSLTFLSFCPGLALSLPPTPPPSPIARSLAPPPRLSQFSLSLCSLPPSLTLSFPVL